jgi:hypothetical protein
MNLSKERIRIKLMGFQDADGSGKYRTWPVLVQRPTLDVNISYPSSLLDCTGRGDVLGRVTVMQALLVILLAEDGRG